MSIRIGAVTGDASYFLMNESERIRLKLPLRAMQPVVSKARHVTGAHITRDTWKSLLEQDERVWLFRPVGHALRHKSVKHYLEGRVSQKGFAESRYKVRVRDPWYITPLPPLAHGFISGMSQNGPIICFNKMRYLTATNTLYAANLRPALSRLERYAWALMLLTTDVRRRVAANNRKYALGLAKTEPGDLLRLVLPTPKVTKDIARTYASAVCALLRGDERQAENLANRAIE